MKKANAVMDETGEEHPTDILVHATGFDLTGSYNRVGRGCNR